MLTAFSEEAKEKWKKIKVSQLNCSIFEYVTKRIISTIGKQDIEYEEDKELILYPVVKLILYNRKGLLKQFVESEKERIKNILYSLESKEITRIVYEIFDVEDEDDNYFYIPVLEFIKKTENLFKFGVLNGNVIIKKYSKNGILNKDIVLLITGHLDVLFYDVPKKIPKEIEDLVKEYSNSFVNDQNLNKSFNKLPFKVDSLPPCIKKIYSDLISGEKVGHYARFVIGSFLINIGFDNDKIVELFQTQENFNVKRTLYHLNYIREKQLLCPNCEKIREYGLCNGNCNVKNPLVYYSKKFK